jgi:putative RNA 2'-phosphotransferase
MVHGKDGKGSEQKGKGRSSSSALADRSGYHERFGSQEAYARELRRCFNENDFEKPDWDNRHFRISKVLSYQLRHNNQNALTKEGYFSLDALASAMTLPLPIALATVVKFNEKGRFEFNAAFDQIRATQGHSHAGVDLQHSATLLKVGTEHAARFAPPWAIHGTTMRAWEKIRTSGQLIPGGDKGGRNENHFATTLPNDAEGSIISGLRQGAEIVIFLDTLQWMQSGMKLYLTTNNVALAADRVHSNFWLAVYRVATKTGLV